MLGVNNGPKVHNYPDIEAICSRIMCLNRSATGDSKRGSTKSESLKMKKWLIRGLLVLVVAGIGFAAYSVYTLRSHGFLRWPVYETEAPEIPELERPAPV